MLLIIGGKSSSCVYPGEHVTMPKVLPEIVGMRKELIDVVDFGIRDELDRFMAEKKLQHPADASRILIAEHAYFALDGRSAMSKRNTEVSNFVQAHRQWGYEHVILLTREVKWIRKAVRDAADIAFDFSA